MVISGGHLDAAGRPARYKVENSWGDVPGDRGYFVMSDAWFEQFVYQVVVPRALAPRDLVAVFDKGEAQTLPPWDPMVSAAAVFVFGVGDVNKKGADCVVLCCRARWRECVGAWLFECSCLLAFCLCDVVL